MNKKLKVILSIIFLVILIIAFIIINGFQTMSVEDYYGDNQDFYYQSKTGDLLINRTNSKTGTVLKTWTRIYALFDRDTIDFYQLLETNKIEIIRSNITNNDLKAMNSQMIDSLLQIGKVKSIIKN